MRPIDADALAVEIGDKVFHDFTDEFYGVMQCIGEAPTIDPEQKWIPCSERLPEPNQFDAEGVAVYYLVQDDWGDMMVASYRRDRTGETWWEQMHREQMRSELIPEDEIAAWMELPKRYREREE